MRSIIGIIFFSSLLGACAPIGPADVGPVPEITSVPTEVLDTALDEVDETAARNRRIQDDTDYRIGRNLPLDAIPPIYDPEFVRAAQSPLEQDELILGVAWDGEAKAYPISVLRIREMVNDELAGIPTLVTW